MSYFHCILSPYTSSLNSNHLECPPTMSTAHNPTMLSIVHGVGDLCSFAVDVAGAALNQDFNSQWSKIYTALVSLLTGQSNKLPWVSHSTPISCISPRPCSFENITRIVVHATICYETNSYMLYLMVYRDPTPDNIHWCVTTIDSERIIKNPLYRIDFTNQRIIDLKTNRKHPFTSFSTYRCIHSGLIIYEDNKAHLGNGLRLADHLEVMKRDAFHNLNHYMCTITACKQGWTPMLDRALTPAQGASRTKTPSPSKKARVVNTANASCQTDDDAAIYKLRFDHAAELRCKDQQMALLNTRIAHLTQQIEKLTQHAKENTKLQLVISQHKNTIAALRKSSSQSTVTPLITKLQDRLKASAVSHSQERDRFMKELADLKQLLAEKEAEFEHAKISTPTVKPPVFSPTHDLEFLMEILMRPTARSPIQAPPDASAKIVALGASIRLSGSKPERHRYIETTVFPYVEEICKDLPQSIIQAGTMVAIAFHTVEDDRMASLGGVREKANLQWCKGCVIGRYPSSTKHMILFDDGTFEPHTLTEHNRDKGDQPSTLYAWDFLIIQE